MSGSEKKIDHRTLPRKKRAPSARDQAIFVAYRTQGRTQASLAKQHDLSQRRISEIIRRVERWLADLIPSEENQLDHDQQLRLDRRLERERNQAIYDRAIRAFDQAPKKLKTIRKGDRDGKPFYETTIRQVAKSGQLLNTALRASRDLGRVADKPAPKPAQLSQEDNGRLRHSIMMDALYDLRRKAEDEKKVVKGQDTQDYISVVNRVVEALAGEPNEGYTDTSPGSPLHQLTTLIAPIGWDKASSEAAGPPCSSPDSPSNSALDLGPGTLDSMSNCSNATPAKFAEVQVPPHLPIQNQKSKIQNRASLRAPAPPREAMSPPRPKSASAEVCEYLDKLKRMNAQSYDPLRNPVYDWMKPLEEPADPTASASESRSPIPDARNHRGCVGR